MRSRSGGNAQVHDIEAIEQILAEFAGAHLSGEVAVGGGEHANVHRHRLAAADAVDDAFLQRAQQLGLQPQIHFRDFVEQQRAAIGFLEFANAPRHRAGEGAFLVTEQFALEQLLGNGGAIDGDERLVLALGFLVNVARQHFLADAALAGDHDRGFGRGDLIGHGNDQLHRRVRGDERALIVADGGEHGGNQLGIGRQRNIFARAGADRARRHHGIDADACGHDRHDNVLGFIGGDERGDIEPGVDHEQVGAAARA